MDRQQGIEYIFMAYRDIGLGQEGVADQVGVAEHHPLGASRCARCKQDGRCLLLSRPVDPDLSFGFQIEDVGGFARRKRYFVPDAAVVFVEAVVTFLVDKQHGSGNGLDQTGHLLHGNLVVQRNHDGASVQNRQVGHGPFRRVLARHADSVAPLDSLFLQVGGGCVYAVPDLKVGEGKVFRLEGGEASSVPMAGTGYFEKLGNRRPTAVEDPASIRIEKIPGFAHRSFCTSDSDRSSRKKSKEYTLPPEPGSKKEGWSAPGSSAFAGHPTSMKYILMPYG